MSADPIASLRSLHEKEETRDYAGNPCPVSLYSRAAKLRFAAIRNLPALLDAAEMLRVLRQDYTSTRTRANRATVKQIDAVLSRLHVED